MLPNFRVTAPDVARTVKSGWHNYVKPDGTPSTWASPMLDFTNTNHATVQLRDTEFVQEDGDRMLITGMNGITDYDIENCVMRTSKLSDGHANMQNLWVARSYAAAGTIKRTEFRRAWKEHGLYTSQREGTLRFEDVLFQNAGAQGIQIRSTNAMDHWTEDRTLELEDVIIRECGQKRGIGRASFSLTVHTQGPKYKVRGHNVHIEVEKQTDVDGTHDSLGGAFFGYMESVEIENLTVSLKGDDPSTPGDDGPRNAAVQLFDYGNKSFQCGPRHIKLLGGRIPVDSIDVRVGAYASCEISGFERGGRIRLLEFTGGDWRLKASIPIEQGYKDGV